MAADDLTEMTDLSLWTRMDGHFVFIKLSGRTVERVFKRFKASYALCHPELAPEPSVVRQIIAKSASETLGEFGMWMWDELPTPLELEVSGQSCEERRSAIVEQLNSKPSIPVLRARLDAAKAQKSTKERKLELKSILVHLQDDSANRCESPGHGGGDSACDSSERDDDEDGRENPDDSEVDNGNTQDLEKNLQKDALFELHGYEFEVKIRKGIDKLRTRKTKELSSVYARILKHRQGENACLDAVFNELAAESTTSDRLTRWTFNTSSGTARALARIAGRPYLQHGEPNKMTRRELLRQEKLPLIIYCMIDALVLDKGVDALLLYTALQEQSFHFTFAKKEISRADMFKFAKNTAQRLRNLDLNEIPDDILVFDPLAVAAWAYRLDFSEACSKLGLTNLAKLGLNFARHFVEKSQDAAQGRLGREFYVPLRDLRMASPLVQNESNDSLAQQSETASAASTTRSISEHPSATLSEAIAAKRPPEMNHGEGTSRRKRPRHVSVSSLLNVEDVDRSSDLPPTIYAAQQSLARQEIQAHGSGPNGCPTGASSQSDFLDGFSMDNMLNWESMGNCTDGMVTGLTFDSSLIGAGMDDDMSWKSIPCLTEEQIEACVAAVDEAMSRSSRV